jgi:hypothetical protein
MGYNSPLATVLPITGNGELTRRPPDALLRGPTTVHDLMRTAEGRRFVQQYLLTPDLDFDTVPDSQSRKKLAHYRP